MADFTTNFRQQVRDLFLAVQYTAFPDDRPSPLFPFFGALINAIPLVWGCAMIPTAECQYRFKSWALVGMLNFFLNMVFGILVVLIVRRRIKEGIRTRVTTCTLFTRITTVDIFAAYVAWEVLWVAIAAARGAETASDTCRRHLLVQLSFTVVYVAIGGLLFTFTFATELGSVPRWRAYAALQYHHALRGYEGSARARRGTATGSGRLEEEEELEGTSAAPPTTRRQNRRPGDSTAPLRAAGGLASDVVVESGATLQRPAPTTPVDGGNDDHTSQDDYTDASPDEEEPGPDARRVRFTQ